MKRAFLIVSLLLCFLAARPQKSADVGIIGGSAVYWGDLENVDYANDITPVYGLLGRYNMNKRIAFRGQLMSGSLRGDGTFSGVYLAEQVARFPSNPIDLYLRKNNNLFNFDRSFQSAEILLEFNFLDYMMGITKKNRFTPFVSVGIGGFYSPAPRSGTLLLNSEVKQVLLPTRILYEPVLMNNETTNKQTALAPILPVGFGIKYNLTKKLGLCAEFIIRKTFTDNIDNLKDPVRFQYMDIVNSSPQPEFVPSPMYNNDWYASVQLSLHWQVWSELGVCKAMDKKQAKSAF